MATSSNSSSSSSSSSSSAYPEIATETEARIVGSSAYTRASHVLAQLSSQTYTLARLFEDCAKRGQNAQHAQNSTTPSTTARQQLSSSSAKRNASRHSRTDLQRLAARDTFSAAFALVVSELEEAAAALVPLSVPGLGVFGFRVFNMGISIPFFDLSPKFAKQHGLRRISSSRQDTSAVTQRLN